jgi:hypothetical protein
VTHEELHAKVCSHPLRTMADALEGRVVLPGETRPGRRTDRVWGTSYGGGERWGGAADPTMP